jgi:hypothetical protein
MKKWYAPVIRYFTRLIKELNLFIIIIYILYIYLIELVAVLVVVF